MNRVPKCNKEKVRKVTKANIKTVVLKENDKKDIKIDVC